MQLGPMVYPGQHYKIARVSECVSILKEREEKKRIEAEERERKKKEREEMAKCKAEERTRKAAERSARLVKKSAPSSSIKKT